MLANPPPQQQAPENTLQAPITGGDSQDIEQAIVARDLQGRSIHNDTVGPAGWTGETPEEREAFVKLLRPVDKVFLEKALPKFHVVTEDYANVPLRQAFNWDEVASYLGTELEGDWFIVAFRSVRKATADNKLLFEADAAAQREAIQSGGLLKVCIARDFCVEEYILKLALSLFLATSTGTMI